MQHNLKTYGVHVRKTPALSAAEVKALQGTLNDRLLATVMLNMNDATTWPRWLPPSQLYRQCFAPPQQLSIPTPKPLQDVTVIGVDLQPPAILDVMPRKICPCILSRKTPLHGSIQLTAQEASVGSVWVLTGSHVLFDKFCQTHRQGFPIDDDDNPISLTAAEFQWYVRELRRQGYTGTLQRVIANKAGQMVLWDSRLVCCMYMPATNLIPEIHSPELALKAMKNVHVLDHYWRQAVYFQARQINA